MLKKATKSKNPLDPHSHISLDIVQKILWTFRKPKVDFLRGVLASLKSTILLELGVLDYASRVTNIEAYVLGLACLFGVTKYIAEQTQWPWDTCQVLHVG